MGALTAQFCATVTPADDVQHAGRFYSKMSGDELGTAARLMYAGGD